MRVPPKKILGVTGIRADYDLLKEFYRRLVWEGYEVALLVGGAHLSARFGMTVDQIEEDGFAIAGTVMSLFDSDEPYGRAKTFATFAQGAADVIASYGPDLVVFPGDREEVLAAAAVAAYMEIPSIHFFAGDHTTDGHQDNPVRHAASKLATVHLVTLPQHKERLIRMGEEPDRIFVVGNPRLDTFVRVDGGDRFEILDFLGISTTEYALVIYHPIAEERPIAPQVIRTIHQQLRRQGLGMVVGIPNSDPGNAGIFQAIEELGAEPDVYVYASLPTDTFIRVYKHATLMVGNSSSGIIEAASVPLPVVNVGLRQRGRFAPRNVIFVDATEQAIREGIKRALSPEFRASLKGLKNPYGDGHASERAARLVAEIPFDTLLRKRTDPLDIPCP